VPDLPSANYVEELLRVTALVHDIGHGPFCHFFDENFLKSYNLTHERLGQLIIREHLGPLIRKVRRSPSGPFAKGEELDPDQIAHLILKDKAKDNSRVPRWLNFLQPVISGSYTGDNLDYVLRDSYMCGVAVGPVDLTRLIHYTLVTDKGFTLHKTGIPALQMFLTTRMYLYSNVYYHRTTRAIDIHLREIFGETMRLLFPHDPRKKMDDYLCLTDWSLLEEVRAWRKARSGVARRLGEEWGRVLARDVKWKMAYSTVLKEKGKERGMDFPSAEHFELQIRKELPAELQSLPLRVDMAGGLPVLFAAAGLLGGSALICLISAYRHTPAALVAPFQYSQMLWGALLGLLIWGDLPDRAVLFGAGIVAASGLFILYRETTLGRRPTASLHPNAAAKSARPAPAS
jgi:uncharacterized protein